MGGKDVARVRARAAVRWRSLGRRRSSTHGAGARESWKGAREIPASSPLPISQPPGGLCPSAASARLCPRGGV